jgi:transcriptional regulator with GAF, ATPase, and Fis domain
MDRKSSSQLIAEAERHLSDTTGNVRELRRSVKRLKRLGADSSNAVDLLDNLLELQRVRRRRLAYLRTLPDDIGGGE